MAVLSWSNEQEATNDDDATGRIGLLNNYPVAARILDLACVDSLAYSFYFNITFEPL